MVSVEILILFLKDPILILSNFNITIFLLYFDIFTWCRFFGVQNILLNVENIANIILVAFEVSISIFRKDHSVL